MEQKIIVRKGGSLRVQTEQPIQIVDQDGNLIKEGNAFSFCRCGLSKKMPFCDGAHKDSGFEQKTEE